MEDIGDSVYLLDVLVYPWGYAVLDSDGLFEGLRIWVHGDKTPCFCAVGVKEELLALLP
jgi:hypothetical protein